MLQLKEKILEEGKILSGQVLKVSSFLNHQIDSDLMMEIGREIAKRFQDAGITKIMTIESSGIAVALAAGAALHKPVLFAKKHLSSNVSGILYQTLVHSFTHGTDYTIVVEREYLSADDRILIVDDFLANGKAPEGLLDLIAQAGAEAAGAAFVIEKGFQEGGSRLRTRGLRVESLAVIDKMDQDGILFRD
ncbi:MAG: xanthine phosphoribosyltransferase [Oscillospiraceae bacterium]|nr:xanthine phosphoribosyltransferase [Oscillospiraceae bacterium]